MKFAIIALLSTCVGVTARPYDFMNMEFNFGPAGDRQPEKKGLGVCNGKLHEACGASVAKLCPDAERERHESVLGIYSCLAQQDPNDVDAKCTQLVQSDPITNARVICAPEIFTACPKAGYLHQHHMRHDSDRGCQNKRCVHDLFPNLSESCKTAFDAAFTKYKEIESISADEVSPMDVDVMRILVPKPDHPLDMTGSEDWQLIGMIFGGTVVVFALISLFLCCKKRRRTGTRGRSIRNASNDVSIPINESVAENYHPLVDQSPSAPPVALPYKPKSVVVATPVYNSTGYPGIQ